MAVKLRLRRMGKKKQPIYKIVAADSRSPRDGKFIEEVGIYFPKVNPHKVEIKEDRALYWLSVGAQPTDTVRSLLRQSGITLKRELIRRGYSPEQIEAELNNWKKLKEASQSSKKKSTSEKASKSIEKTTEEQTETNNLETKSEVMGATSEEESDKTEK